MRPWSSSSPHKVVMITVIMFSIASIVNNTNTCVSILVTHIIISIISSAEVEEERTAL